jgi:hypothetical protein
VSAAGATHVTLAGVYSNVKSIQLTARASVSVVAVYDAVVTGSSVTNGFDVYLFSGASQVAGVVDVLFKGV